MNGSESVFTCVCVCACERSCASFAARSCASIAVIAPAESILLDTSLSLRVCSAATRQQNVGPSVVFLLQHRTTMLQSASGHSQVTSSFDSLPPPVTNLLIVCDFGIGYEAQRQQFPGEYAKSPIVAVPTYEEEDIFLGTVPRRVRKRLTSRFPPQIFPLEWPLPSGRALLLAQRFHDSDCTCW